MILNIDNQFGESLMAPPLDASIAPPQPASLPQLLQALTEGHWNAACAMATRILAKHQPDVDALGIFAMCAAIRNDTIATDKALSRLQEAEPNSRYYGPLAQGILLIQHKTADKAEVIFRKILEDRSGDPLAKYFSGEALHARGKDNEAIEAFLTTLKSWPDHAPALSSIARLTTKGNASIAKLKSAIEMTEHAVRIDPSNRGYWQQLADLHERTGNQGKANAIRLQWLKPRSPLKGHP